MVKTKRFRNCKSVKIFFLLKETTGTHINISGAGVTKFAKNKKKKNAVKLIEFLSSEEAQATLQKEIMNILLMLK